PGHYRGRARAAASARIGHACGAPRVSGGIMDITQLILDDHHEQRRLFAILEQIGRSDAGTLEAIWARLSAFPEVRAAAEGEIFYPGLLRGGAGKPDGSLGIGSLGKNPAP